jgi:hypothetical protein
MVRSASLSLFFFTLLAFAGLAFVLFGDDQAQLQRRDAQREKDLTIYLDRIEAYALANKTVPSFTSTFQQVGTSSEGCQLTTAYCQIPQAQCIDLHMLMNNRSLSMPSDLIAGSYYKTGYAVKYDTESKVVTVIACHAEGGATLSASRSLRTQLEPQKKNEKK